MSMRREVFELKSTLKLEQRHAAETGSQKAQFILQHWDSEKANFLQVCPKEMLRHIPHPLSLEQGAIPAE